MKKFLEVALSILGAFLFYSIGGLSTSPILQAVNAFSLVVVFFAIRRGEVSGAFIGTVCGLIQDSFSAGVFGLAGLTKTMLGFWTGYFARRIDVGPFFSKFLFLVIMAGLELGAWLALKSFIFSERVIVGVPLLVQPVVTSISVSLLFVFLRRHGKRSS